MSESYAVGIDLGGSTLRVALYRDLAQTAGGAAPRPVAERREPVGDDRAPALLAARLAAAVLEVCATAGPAATGAPVGIGLAGMLDPRPGWVANSPHLRWRDVDFLAHLRPHLGDRRLGLYNDVDAVTWGEKALGAGRGARDLLAVFVGTGIGASVIANGQLVTGAHHCAAELGHTKVVLGPAARPCNCGLAGCVEAYAGGAYLEARAGRHAGLIDQAAAAGEPWAIALLDEAAALLGLALANAVTLLDPERLILGGGVWTGAPTLRRLTLAAFRQVCNPPVLAHLTIADAALGDAAGSVGSALLIS